MCEEQINLSKELKCPICFGIFKPDLKNCPICDEVFVTEKSDRLHNLVEDREINTVEHQKDSPVRTLPDESEYSTKCSEHNSEYTHVCEKCRKYCCNNCMICCSALRHKIEKISDFAKKEKAFLEESKNKSKVDLNYLNEITTLIEKALQQNDFFAEEASKKVENFYENFINRILETKGEVLEIIRNKKLEKDTILANQIQEINHKIVAIEESISSEENIPGQKRSTDKNIFDIGERFRNLASTSSENRNILPEVTKFVDFSENKEKIESCLKDFKSHVISGIGEVCQTNFFILNKTVFEDRFESLSSVINWNKVLVPEVLRIKHRDVQFPVTINIDQEDNIHIFDLPRAHLKVYTPELEIKFELGAQEVPRHYYYRITKNGELLVVKYEYRATFIKVFSKNGAYLRNFCCEGKFTNISGVYADNVTGDIFVWDDDRKQIHIFSERYDFKKSVPYKGGNVISTNRVTRNIYIAQNKSNCIEIVDRNFTLIKKITGTPECPLDDVTTIHFDQHNNMFVVNNNKICVFSKDVFIYKFEEIEGFNPVTLCTNSKNQVFAPDKLNENVKVYNLMTY